MKRFLVSFIMAACVAGSLSAQETLDSLSYAMGDYFMRIVLDSQDKKTQQIKSDREEYIRGFSDGLNVYRQERTTASSYYEGQQMGLFFLMSINFEPFEDKDLPHLDCLIEGLRKVADNTVVLPKDTIGAHHLLLDLDDEAMLSMVDGDSCRIETTMGIFLGLQAYNPLQPSDRDQGDSISVEDQQTFAAGMADVLENSIAASTYDMGRFAALFYFIDNMRMKQLLGLDFDYDAIIDGARGALELTERKMSVEEVELCLTQYYAAQYDVQAAGELDNNDDNDVVIVEEEAVKETHYDFEVDGIYYNIVNGNEASVTNKDGNSLKNPCYSGALAIPATVTYNGVTYSVTSIGTSAFAYSGLTSINIPNSITSISVYAFKDCSGLTSVSIGNSVTEIDEFAFQGCSGLTGIVVASGNPTYDSRNNCNAIIETTDNKLILGCMNTTIPNSVTTIGSFAFSGCSGLTSIDIPNSVTSIRRHAFSGCSGLTSIDIPNSVTSIAWDAFSNCSGLTRIDIPNSITEINGGTFFGCSGLTSVDIPNSVTSIGDEAFSSCSGLTNVTIPNSVTTIGEMAFQNCSGLTSITIPNSVTTLGGFAFSMCSGLKDVYSYIDNPSLVSMDSEVFYLYFANYKKRTLHVPPGTLEAYKADTNWSQYFGNIVEMEP